MSDLLLLIEDDPGTAHLVHRYLTRLHNGEVAIAKDCDGAVNYLKVSPKCTRVIADLTLPDAEGMQVIDSLRASAPDVSIVAVSGFATSGEVGGPYRLAAARRGVSLLPKHDSSVEEWAKVVYAVLLMDEARSAAASERVQEQAAEMFAALEATTPEVQPPAEKPAAVRLFDPAAVPRWVPWALAAGALFTIALALLALLAAMGVNVDGFFTYLESRS